ncbi:hypothetical protein QVZ41_14105 [Wenyingzhuangia sp. chi5]|uniref:Uncharacterized protein n=1 Tax=Wenyingzhuangia gilva TaxID=3057677 RepID=A0ABT8VVJ1_9FLAO|nr:hypothetical protein [Wenyingzhuangia sp. chi5]MDO3695981.1 hypothetical protein [Wenyingzhuangia sp. chi5]
MKNISIFIITLFMNITLFGQGTNNKYEIDSEDLKNVFEEQGIHIFKYPFKVDKGEYISISYEVYEKGKLQTRKNPIEDFQIKQGIQINHHISRKDTIAFHRFYFFEKNKSLIMEQVLPGIELNQKIDLSKINFGSFNSRSNVPENLLNKQEILFYYGNESDGWLECTTGVSKENLIKSYDLVILFYAEKITKKETKTILKKIESTAHNNG